MPDYNPGTDVKRAPTVLCFDVEDLVAPESDDVAQWLAEILSDYGLPGSFMVVGEKARLWERRGRLDVIKALQKHHLAFHSTWHSVHPSTTEICLDRNFAEGMEDLWTWDREGWADTERILGRPLLGWARTGSSWSPSVMGLMGRMGRAYAYSLVRAPGHDVCWYAGCLGFYGEGIGGFDDTLRPTVYGPLTMPPVTSAGERNAAGVLAGARDVLNASAKGYLPAAVTIEGESFGIGTYFVALAEALLGHVRVSGPPDAPYPAAAESVARDVARTIPGWIVHPDAMDLSCLLEQTRLQCWTLKPAWPQEVIRSYNGTSNP